MSNRIVSRVRVPHKSKAEFWVDPKDVDSDGAYVATLTMIDSQENLIYLDKDITSNRTGNPFKTKQLKAGEIYSASVKVVFSSTSAKATINNRIRKLNGEPYGGEYPHEVPQSPPQGDDSTAVGRQTVIIVMESV